MPTPNQSGIAGQADRAGVVRERVLGAAKGRGGKGGRLRGSQARLCRGGGDQGVQGGAE